MLYVGHVMVKLLDVISMSDNVWNLRRMCVTVIERTVLKTGYLRLYDQDHKHSLITSYRKSL